MKKIAIQTPTPELYAAVCEALGYDLPPRSWDTFGVQTVVYADSLMFGATFGAERRHYELIGAAAFLAMTDQQQRTLLTTEPPHRPRLSECLDHDGRRSISLWLTRRYGMTRIPALVCSTLIRLASIAAPTALLYLAYKHQII